MAEEENKKSQKKASPNKNKSKSNIIEKNVENKPKKTEKNLDKDKKEEKFVEKKVKENQKENTKINEKEINKDKNFNEKKENEKEENKVKLNVVDKRKKPVRKPKKASNMKKLKAIKPDKKTTRKFVKSNRNTLIAVCSAMFLLVLAIVFNANNVIKISDKQIMFSKEYSMSSKASFYVNGENIFYSSKDGMIYLDKKGETIWSDTFTMSSPNLLSDKDYVAVVDKGGRTVNVYDKTGRLYQINTLGDITTVAINPIGCCAVVYRVENDYRVDVYSNNGQTMFECARASKDGIPLGIDISEDGSIIALSFVDYNEIKIKSNVIFYYTTKTDAQQTDSSDGLVSAIEVPNAIASIVKFLPKNQCFVASDESMMLVDCSVKNKFEKKWEKKFDNYVTAFDILDDKKIVVAYGEPVSVSDEKAMLNENTIHWYNLMGKELNYDNVGERVTNIEASDKGVVATVNKEYIAYNSNGNEIWKYDAIQNVLSMQFYKYDDRVVVVTPTKMQILDVKKGATMKEQADEEVEEVSSETTTSEQASQTTTKQGE